MYCLHFNALLHIPSAGSCLLFQELKTFQIISSLILTTHLATINKNDCEIFAAINIKEKSHEASEYKSNYLHLTLQTPRLGDIHLMVTCIPAAQ